jgi:hypothetical protein
MFMAGLLLGAGVMFLLLILASALLSEEESSDTHEPSINGLKVTFVDEECIDVSKISGVTLIPVRVPSTKKIQDCIFTVDIGDSVALIPSTPKTAADILEHGAERKEKAAQGRKPWRVMQREAELASSPEIQRELKTEKELKEIANA